MVLKCNIGAKRNCHVEKMHTEEGEEYHNDKRRGNKPLE